MPASDSYLLTVNSVLSYLAKAAFPQDLVENKFVQIDTGQVGNTGLRPGAGPLPQSAIVRCI